MMKYDMFSIKGSPARCGLAMGSAMKTYGVRFCNSSMGRWCETGLKGPKMVSGEAGRVDCDGGARDRFSGSEGAGGYCYCDWGR